MVVAGVRKDKIEKGETEICREKHLFTETTIKPMVNQIELHPYQRKEELVKYCQENDIVPMGYSPLTRGHYINDPLFVEIASRYGRTPAQILIRWSVQLGYITIPKSVRSERIIENASVFDFTLTEDDMTLLNSLPNASGSWDPTLSPWEG